MLPGSSEWLVIFAVALVVFGPSKLPKLGSALGEAIRNFQKGLQPPSPPPHETTKPAPHEH